MIYSLYYSFPSATKMKALSFLKQNLLKESQSPLLIFSHLQLLILFHLGNHPHLLLKKIHQDPLAFSLFTSGLFKFTFDIGLISFLCFCFLNLCYLFISLFWDWVWVWKFMHSRLEFLGFINIKWGIFHRNLVGWDRFCLWALLGIFSSLPLF